MEINTTIVEHKFKFILQSPVKVEKPSKTFNGSSQRKPSKMSSPVMEVVRETKEVWKNYSKWVSLIPTHLLHVE